MNRTPAPRSLVARPHPLRSANSRLLRESGRVEAFSDGVLAIAATILVFTLAVPTVEEAADGGALWRALLANWPTFFAFAVSFVNILVLWASHHNIFSLIRRVDHVFILINGLILLGVSAIPFATQLLATHLGHAGEHVAAAVYSAVGLFISLSFNALWHWVRMRNHCLLAGISPQILRQLTRQHAVGPFVYLSALALSFVSAWASLACFVLVALYYAIPSAATAPLSCDDGAEDA